MKQAVKKILRTLWELRSPRDRKIIVVFATALSIIFYVLLVQTAEKSRTVLRNHVMTLRTQAAHLDQQAIEYHQLLGKPAVTLSPTDIHTLVQTRINDAGLSPVLQRMDTLDKNHVIVTFAAITFVDWLHWVVDLDTQHIRIAQCRIEALSTPGRVNVSATLVRQ